MTANLSLTPKKTATTVVLVCIGIAAIASVLPQILQPVTGAGWRQDTPATPRTALLAPVQARGSNSEGSALTEAGETSAARGRN